MQNKSCSILTFRLEKLICVFFHSCKLVEKKTTTQFFSSKYFSEENSHFHTPAKKNAKGLSNSSSSCILIKLIYGKHAFIFQAI